MRGPRSQNAETTPPGVQVGEKKSPAIRLTLAQRKALTSREKKASGSSKHPTTPNAYRFEHWEQFNYDYDSRQPEFKLHSICICVASYLACRAAKCCCVTLRREARLNMLSMFT